MKVYFTDVFNISEDVFDQYGAFNISLLTDLPLFIDPFLLFNSSNERYQVLHDEIIRYLRFLKNKSEAGLISRGLIKAWYCFKEVKQNWLGFGKSNNNGRGLGPDFAEALDKNLVHIFKNFGNEQITQGSHLEKLCLIKDGVGKDMISDFTTNLIKEYLLEYTQDIAQSCIDKTLRKKYSVPRVYFDYTVERWMNKIYELPCYNDDYVILIPKDILTKDETWINHKDLINDFEEIPEAIENDALRAQINNYFYSRIPEEPNKEDYVSAINLTIEKYPEILDYFIRYKEEKGDEAVQRSALKVDESTWLYIKQFGELINTLSQKTGFYSILGNTKEETFKRIEFFKDIIENKGGHLIFYANDKPIHKETDLHILFRLTWYATPSDVSREVNDGRGPADFKISRGSHDKTLVEFKLASNSKLKRNLEKQLEIYKRASDAEHGYKVIVYFNEDEMIKVKKILSDLDMLVDPNIILIDARKDNKPSASNA